LFPPPPLPPRRAPLLHTTLGVSDVGAPLFGAQVGGPNPMEIVFVECRVGTMFFNVVV
jgi:hypothetical protein